MIQTDLHSRLIRPGQVPGVGDPRLQAETITNPDAVLRPVHRYIQMFEDCMYPWDKAIVKALRSFDPRIVPLCSVSVYKHPEGGLEKFVRHVIALEVNPLEFREPVLVNLLPPVSPGSVNYGRHPNTWLKGWSGPQPNDTVTPGDFWPFDWEVVNYLKARFSTYDSNTERVVRERVNSEEYAKQKALDDMDKEIDYRLEHDKKHLKAAAQRVSPDLVRRGILYDTRPDPFVHLGG